MRPKNRVENPSVSNDKLPLYKKVGLTATAFAVATGSALGLTGCGDKLEATPNESTPSSSAPVTPGTTEPTAPAPSTEAPSPTGTPSSIKTTEPTPETNTPKPSPAETSKGPLDIYSLSSTENLTEQERDELREVFTNMSEDEYYELPAQTRLHYITNEINWYDENNWLTQDDIVFDHEIHPGLYKYNPLEIASPDNTPEEIVQQLIFIRQFGVMPVGYEIYPNAETLRKISSNVLLHPDLQPENISTDLKHLDGNSIKLDINRDIDTLINSGEPYGIMNGVKAAEGADIRGTYTDPITGKTYPAVQINEIGVRQGINTGGPLFNEGGGIWYVAVWNDEVGMWQMIDTLATGNIAIDR